MLLWIENCYERDKSNRYFFTDTMGFLNVYHSLNTIVNSTDEDYTDDTIHERYT